MELKDCTNRTVPEVCSMTGSIPTTSSCYRLSRLQCRLVFVVASQYRTRSGYLISVLPAGWRTPVVPACVSVAVFPLTQLASTCTVQLGLLAAGRFSL